MDDTTGSWKERKPRESEPTVPLPPITRPKRTLLPGPDQLQAGTVFDGPQGPTDIVSLPDAMPTFDLRGVDPPKIGIEGP
jgi:hypothetical protein